MDIKVKRQQRLLAPMLVSLLTNTLRAFACVLLYLLNLIYLLTLTLLGPCDDETGGKGMLLLRNGFSASLLLARSKFLDAFCVCALLLFSNHQKTLM